MTDKPIPMNPDAMCVREPWLDGASPRWRCLVNSAGFHVSFAHLWRETDGKLAAACNGAFVVEADRLGATVIGGGVQRCSNCARIAAVRS